MPQHIEHIGGERAGEQLGANGDPARVASTQVMARGHGASWHGRLTSALAEAEGMACRVEEHPERGPRLVVMLGCAQPEDGRFRRVEIVDVDIDVHLLRHLLTRPTRCREPVHFLEADGVAVLGAHRPPVVAARLHLPIKQCAVELRQSLGVGAVEDDNGVASDSHALTVDA